MTAASWFEQALLLISSNVLLSRLVIATLEFSVLALVVVGLIRMFRPRSRRLVALAILVVLVRPVIGLMIGTPVPLVSLGGLAGIGSQPKLQTMEMTIIKEAPVVPAGDNKPELTLSPPKLDQPEVKWTPLGAPTDLKMLLRPGDSARVVLWIWATGALLTGLWFARDRVKLARLVRRSIPAPAEVSHRYSEVAGKLGISRAPRLCVTDQLESPALAGYFKTVVLVPSWMTRPENSSMLTWSLRHELVHRRHRDAEAGFLVTVSKALFFFNPLVWWLAGKWREETELACDEEVVRQTGDRVTYAENMYATLAHVHAHRRVAVGASLFATRTQIGKRIETLLRHNGACRKTGRLGLAVVLVVAVASVVTGAEPGARAIFFHDIYRDFGENLPAETDIASQLQDGSALKLTVRGRYTVSADGSDIGTLTPNGRVVIAEETADGVRKYAVTADDFGRLERTYSVNGFVQPIDEGGREWLESRLDQIDRLAVHQNDER